MSNYTCGIAAGERDEAWAGSDLMEYFQLMRLYNFSQTDLVPTNYLKGVPGNTTLWRQDFWLPTI